MKTSLNKYIELRKGESGARKKTWSAKHCLGSPDSLFGSPKRTQRRERTNSTEVVP